MFSVIISTVVNGTILMVLLAGLAMGLWRGRHGIVAALMYDAHRPGFTKPDLLAAAPA